MISIVIIFLLHISWPPQDHSTSWSPVSIQWSRYWIYCWSKRRQPWVPVAKRWPKHWQYSVSVPMQPDRQDQHSSY